MLAPGQCTILNNIPIDDKENDNTPEMKTNFFIFNLFAFSPTRLAFRYRPVY